MNAQQLVDFIISSALNTLPERFKPTQDQATRLLAMIAAHESNGGVYVKQIQGIALGIYQMEPATYHDLLDYLRRKVNESPDFEALYTRLSEGGFNEDRLMYDLRFATIMARIYLWRISQPLPDKDDIDAMAEYAKKYWNTPAGKATPKMYADAYIRLFAPKTPKARTRNAKTKASKDTASKPAKNNA